MSNRERLTALIARARSQKSLLEQARTSVSALSDRINALRSATYWAELDSGASIKLGDTVRYFGRNYVCIQAHTKALLRSPLNDTYWEVSEDE